MSRTPYWIKVMAAGISVATLLSGALADPERSGPGPSPAAAKRATVDNPGPFTLDPFATTAATVAALRSRHPVVLCHLRADVWEPHRPDAHRFDPTLLGAPTGFGEPTRWLDIRRWDLLVDVLADRLELCAAKGFDGVAFSGFDGYAHSTGFAFGEADGRAFAQALVALAHHHGLGAYLLPSI